MRLDKYISYALSYTRSEARDAIRNDKIKVNGSVVKKTDFHINEFVDKVFYKEEELIYKNYVYIMMNKPSGFVSATVDNVNKTVLELIKGYEKYDLSIGGRLDKDVEGLLILSNEGKFIHNLTSPKKDISKIYFAVVDGVFKEEDKFRFKEGFELIDGSNRIYKSKPAELNIIGENEAYITVSEGKFHQVKNMCLKLGKPITYLKRVEIGGLKLDLSLKVGEYRELTVEEVESLKKQFT